MRLPIALAGLLFAVSTAAALEPPAYLLAPDDAYAWSAKTTTRLEGAEVTVLRLTSQKWQGKTWRHWMHVVRPDEVAHTGTALFLIAGGSTSKDEPRAMTPEVAVLREVAIRTRSTLIVLSQVPNQPLFDGKSEDAIIAHTFAKFLETGDESWPALLPMTKSAMRGMDAAQAFLKERYRQDVGKFVVTGASKRGWTTWMTAAFDPRVAAIAPMVIDTLNFPRQMKLQVESFGDYSDQIGDYTALNLPEKLKTAEGKRLVELVDPHVWRERFTMPKLIVLGTNDRYWPVDALKVYLGDLPGETLVHYVPNAGHGLGPGAVEAIASWYMNLLEGRERPKFTWETCTEEGCCTTTLVCAGKPVRVELWRAASETRDFRNSRWTCEPLELKDGRVSACVDHPDAGWIAWHIRVTWDGPLGQEYALCTNVETAGAPAGK
ncbi:MAG: PhoPQ-activated pathogenicity-like protein PqaA type [Candidatus Brocadiae bacterium]|nr:PhoPQ-activated pathogenicity-like protein PqaA type [Candidatus Brocadiia bacterium]